jgi:hypothetical protein
VTNAVIAFGTFIRITSASKPSSFKKPFFNATPAGRNDTLALVTERRIFSAAKIDATVANNMINMITATI